MAPYGQFQKGNDQMLLISETSKKVDLPVATIRYYADLELIPSIIKNDRGQRLFDDESIAWLEGIKFLRELNVPLPEIKKYIEICQKSGVSALKKRHALLLKQRVYAEREVQNSQQRLDKLNYKIKFEEDVLAGRKKDSLSAARRFNQ